MPPFDNKNEYNNIKFSDFKIKPKTTFSGIYFSECTFEDCDFTETEFAKCVFENCKFISCYLNMIRVTDCRFAQPILKSCKMVGIDWSVSNNKMGLELNATDCDLSYNTFEKIDISSSKLINCKIHEADFTKTIAKKVLFKGSDFDRSTFQKTNLSQADFSKAINYSFDISNNNCKKAIFDCPEVLSLLEYYGIIIKE